MVLGPEEIERAAPGAELEPARFPELPAHVEPCAEQQDGTEVIEQTAERRVSVRQLENELHTETPCRESELKWRRRSVLRARRNGARPAPHRRHHRRPALHRWRRRAARCARWRAEIRIAREAAG